jgi:hypothetical protein
MPKRRSLSGKSGFQQLCGPRASCVVLERIGCGVATISRQDDYQPTQLEWRTLLTVAVAENAVRVLDCYGVLNRSASDQSALEWRKEHVAPVSRDDAVKLHLTPSQKRPDARGNARILAGIEGKSRTIRGLVENNRQPGGVNPKTVPPARPIRLLALGLHDLIAPAALGAVENVARLAQDLLKLTASALAVHEAVKSRMGADHLGSRAADVAKESCEGHFINQ